MSEYNAPVPRPKTVLNHRSLAMYAPNGEGKFASLGIDLKKNDVMITVRTNIPGDANNDYGRLTAQVPLDKFYTFMEWIKHAATTDEPFRWAYEHKDRKFIGPGKMTDGPVLMYRLVVGREENGVVYISVVLEKRPNIKFSFLNDTKTLFKDSDGNEMPKNLESKFLALGKVKAFRDYLALVLKEQYKHPEPKPQNGGGGGGGWKQGNQGGGGGGGGGNYSGGNNGGNSAPAGAAMASDDIPW